MSQFMNPILLMSALEFTKVQKEFVDIFMVVLNRPFVINPTCLMSLPIFDQGSKRRFENSMVMIQSFI